MHNFFRICWAIAAFNVCIVIGFQIDMAWMLMTLHAHSIIYPLTYGAILGVPAALVMWKITP